MKKKNIKNSVYRFIGVKKTIYYLKKCVRFRKNNSLKNKTFDIENQKVRGKPFK